MKTEARELCSKRDDDTGFNLKRNTRTQNRQLSDSPRSLAECNQNQKLLSTHKCTVYMQD